MKMVRALNQIEHKLDKLEAIKDIYSVKNESASIDSSKITK